MSEFSDYCRRNLPQEITSEEMNVIEENAEFLGLDRRLMMENAGATVAYFISERTDVSGRVAAVVCGTGNNGGDGFVAARHLRILGAKIKIVLLGQASDIRSEQSRANWELIENMEDVEKTFVESVSQLPEVDRVLQESDFIVDAILGTGVQGNLREPILSVVDSINKAGKMKFAVDTPSGLNPSTGEIHGDAVKADFTITFHKMKRGLADKGEYTGKVFVRGIGVPVEAEFFVGPGDVRRVVKPRKTYSHKGDYGSVLIVGGSELYSGAPALAALSSLRTGAGLTYVAAPKDVAYTIRHNSPDLIVYPLTSSHLSPQDVDLIEDFFKKVDSIVVGPGLGTHRETSEAVRELVKRLKHRIPVVLDADGFKAMESGPSALEDVIATPHIGEFKKVFGIGVGEKWWDKIDEAVEAAKKYHFTLLLKGHDTVITDGSKVKVNRWGTPGLAVGGTGDVLSGILATFLAWGRDKFLSSAAAAYVHGDAGRKAVQKKGFHILASDVIREIPNALKTFDRELTN
ncbi:MAG: NAD(P)H-hydrate dehydratase [Nitrososphaeria archaeon]